MKKFLLVLFSTMFLFSVGQAHAASYVLNLMGNVSNAQVFSDESESIHDDYWTLDLEGFTPLTVYQGDTFNATIIFDESVTIGASVSATWLYLGLYDDNNSNLDTVTSATTIIYYGANQILQQDDVFETTDWLPAGTVLVPPDNLSPITFDKVTIYFTVDQIGGSANDSLYLTDATFYAIRQSPVPVPPSIFLLGSGLVGLAGIRRKVNKKG